MSLDSKHSLTREEKCRVLTDFVRGPWDESMCRVCGWPLMMRADDGCIRTSCAMRPSPTRRADADLDFYTSEEASALLLEKMPNCVLERCKSEDGDYWSCVADQYANQYIPGFAVQCDRDRKIAIAEAAYQFCTRNHDIASSSNASSIENQP